MEKKMNTDKKQNILKTLFYFISLWLLFMLMAIKNANLFDGMKFIGIENITFKHLIISIVFLFLGLISLILVKFLNYKFKGALNPCYEIEKIENENFEIMSFIATYIIPLACIELTKINDIIIFILILVVLGVINLKLDLYMANPTLSLIGYKLYSVKFKGYENSFIVISKESLVVGDNVDWKPLSKNRYFVRRK